MRGVSGSIVAWSANMEEAALLGNDSQKARINAVTLAGLVICNQLARQNGRSNHWANAAPKGLLAEFKVECIHELHFDMLATTRPEIVDGIESPSNHPHGLLNLLQDTARY